MKRTVLSLLPCLAFAFPLMFMSGCDGNKTGEGVPKNVDMTKDYSPMAKPLTFNPADSAKAEEISRKAAAEAGSDPTKTDSE